MASCKCNYEALTPESVAASVAAETCGALLKRQCGNEDFPDPANCQEKDPNPYNVVMECIDTELNRPESAATQALCREPCSESEYDASIVSMEHPGPELATHIAPLLAEEVLDQVCLLLCFGMT